MYSTLIRLLSTHEISPFYSESLFERPTTSEANPKISSKLDSVAVFALDDATYKTSKW